MLHANELKALKAKLMVILIPFYFFILYIE